MTLTRPQFAIAMLVASFGLASGTFCIGARLGKNKASTTVFSSQIGDATGSFVSAHGDGWWCSITRKEDGGVRIEGQNFVIKPVGGGFMIREGSVK